MRGCLPFDVINAVREKYSPGTVIIVDEMREERYPVPPGSKATVRFVDDIGTINCAFENGRQLGVLPDIDEFHRMEEKDNGKEL